jgi:hypothetical protein
VDDEAWVERLRRAVTGEVAPAGVEQAAEVNGRPPEPEGAPPDPLPELADAPAVAAALRDLERRVAAVDIRLRQLNEEWDRLVDQVADAVVARLEERSQTLSG